MTIGDQMLNYHREETTMMGSTSMDSTNIFSPWDLIENAFQGVNQEHVHMEITFMPGHVECFHWKNN